MRENVKILKILFLSGLTGLGSISWVLAAYPPSVQTKEETLWRELSGQSRAELASDETLRIMNQFLKLYPEHPKAVNARYMLAERDFQKGSYQQAAAGYERFLQAHSNHLLSDSAAFRLGECFFNLKAYNSARTAWEKVSREFGDSGLAGDAMEFLALLSMRDGQWGRADEQWKDLERQYSTHARFPRVRENHGMTLYHIKEYDRSAKMLEGLEAPKGVYYRALSLFSLKLYENLVASFHNFDLTKPGPFQESASYLKAEGFFQKKNYNLAAAEFALFVRQFSKSPLASYASLRLAAAYLWTQKPGESVKICNQLLASSPGKNMEIFAYFVKASALLEQENFSAASETYKKVSAGGDLPELSAAALLRKAWCHKNLKEFAAHDEGLKNLKERYPSSSQTAMAEFLQGVRLYEIEKWEEAGNQFESGLLRYPYSAFTEASMALMAISYTRAARPDRIMTAANSALKILEKSYSSASVYWRAQSCYFIGRAYFDTQRYKEAAPFFEKVAINFTDHPLAPRSCMFLAWSLLELGKFDLARAMAGSVLDSKDADKALKSNAQFLIAVSYFNAKNYTVALTHLANFLKNNPNHSLAPQAHYLLGLSFHQKKVFGSAIEQWQECIRRYPDHPLAQESYLHVGTLYFKAGKFSEAAQYFRKFRERWPKSQFGQTAFWQELQSYFNGKDDETAVKIYPFYVDKYSDAENVKDAGGQLEMIYYRRGAGDPEKLQDFLARYPRSPFAPSARFKLGDMAMEQKKWTIAASEMEQFIRDYPNDSLAMDAEYALGLAYENMGSREKAVIQYRNLIEHFASKPGAVSAAFRLGTLFFNQENYQEALQAFLFASERKISEEIKSNLLYNIAVCYENLGKPEDAGSAYLKFAKVSKQPEQVREALMTGSLLLKKAQKYDEAAQGFKWLLKDAGSKETELKAVNLIAECYQAQGKKSPAISAYEKLLTMEPVSNDARLVGLAQLAYLYEEKKAFAEALRVYEKISVSGGKAEWVNSAKARMEILSKSLNPLP